MTFPRVALRDTIVIKKICSVHYFEFSKTYTFPGEKHNFWEMVYVDKGRIIEAGSHDYLKDAGGVYQKIYEIQTGGAEEAAI